MSKILEKIRSKLDGDDNTTSSSSTTGGTSSTYGSTTGGIDNTPMTSSTAGGAYGSKYDSKYDDNTTGTSSTERSSAVGDSSYSGNTSSSRATDSTTSAPGDAKFETVTQSEAPAVSHERFTASQHEEVQPTLESERHQHHYHTTEQPLTDRQVMPEKRVEQVADTQYREFQHGDDAKLKAQLAAEQGKYQDTRTEAETEKTYSQNPTLATEHQHHHLHETIQPVINREIGQHTTIHTTVPIKETHHEAPQVHATSTAPTMTLEEYNSKIGGTTGSSTGVSGTTGTTSGSDNYGTTETSETSRSNAL